MTSVRIDFIPRTYDEDEYFRCVGDPEPYVRWHDILFHSHFSSWRIKIALNIMTFAPLSQDKSSYPDFFKTPITNKLKRCKEFQAFISFINFDNLPLVDNTVTRVELVFVSKDTKNTKVGFQSVPLHSNVNSLPENRLVQVAPQLRCVIREDASRVLYPSYINDPSTPSKWLSDIRKKNSIDGGVHRVQFNNEEEIYIYKEIERPFYKPTDTSVFLQELQNLKLFREAANIVHLLAVVVSLNPYQTTIGVNDQIVLRGFLLEYHSQGTLEQALINMKAFSWRKWPLQIGIGLSTMHQKNITHMDLKSSNIVIDDDGNAAIIDIGGIGHVSQGWQAPEILEAENPFSLSLDARKKNDIWAYGKLLSVIANSAGSSDEVTLLNEVAADTMKHDPALRVELVYAISRLKEFR